MLLVDPMASQPSAVICPCSLGQQLLQARAGLQLGARREISLHAFDYMLWPNSHVYQAGLAQE